MRVNPTRTALRFFAAMATVAAASAAPPQNKPQAQAHPNWAQQQPLVVGFFVDGTVKWPPVSEGAPANTNATAACGALTVFVSDYNAYVPSVRKATPRPVNPANYASGCKFTVTGIPKNEPRFIHAFFTGNWSPPLHSDQNVASARIPFTLTGDSATFTLQLHRNTVTPVPR